MLYESRSLAKAQDERISLFASVYICILHSTDLSVYSFSCKVSYFVRFLLQHCDQYLSNRPLTVSTIFWILWLCRIQKIRIMGCEFVRDFYERSRPKNKKVLRFRSFYFLVVNLKMIVIYGKINSLVEAYRHLSLEPLKRSELGFLYIIYLAKLL